MKNYHCCATCKWFVVEKEPNRRVSYRCSRLGYETKPAYQFNCWEPKEQIRQKIQQQTELE